MNTFPMSTEGQRTDLKRRLQETVVKWLEEHKMANGSVSGRFSLYDAVDHAVDSEFEKVSCRVAENSPRGTRQPSNWPL